MFIDDALSRRRKMAANILNGVGALESLNMILYMLLEKLNKIGTSMIIATHDYDLILNLEGQVYKCEDGKFFEVKRK